MKQIAIILPSLKNVGPNKVALTIINENLNSKDINFKVFYVKEIIELDFPCETEKLTFRNLRKLYNYDVIHSHMLRPDIINAFLPFYKGVKLSTIHNIVTEDLFYTHGKFVSELVSRMWCKVWSKLDKVVVLSEFAKKFYITKKLDKNKITIISNGVEKHDNLNPLTPEDRSLLVEFKGTKKLVGSICLANPRKGLEQVIKALSKLPDHKFVIIGDGPVVKELQHLANEYGVLERFLVIGYRENARAFLDYIDYFIVPSRSEGFPLALLEAAMAKKKIICSSLPIFKEVFEDDEVSFFELDNINSLEAAIINADNNNIESAFTRSSINYSGTAMAGKYKNCYLSNKEF